MTQKLTTMGHRTAFNNGLIESYKRPRSDNVKQFVLVWLYRYFDMSVIDESYVEETCVWRSKF